MVTRKAQGPGAEAEGVVKKNQSSPPAPTLWDTSVPSNTCWEGPQGPGVGVGAASGARSLV